MQENNSVSASDAPIIVPQVVVEQPKQNSFLTILLSVLLILSVSIAGFFAYQTQKLVNELTLLRTESTPMVTVEPTIEPVATNSASATADPTAGWKTYTNDQYKFEFKYPSDGKLEISQTGYVRIQNYISNDLPMLKKGEFYMEFNLPPIDSTCSNLIVDPKVSNIQGGILYKGLGQEGGDAGGVRYALCAEKEKMNLYLQVTENDQKGSISNQILSTFKFTN